MPETSQRCRQSGQNPDKKWWITSMLNIVGPTFSLCFYPTIFQKILVADLPILGEEHIHIGCQLAQHVCWQDTIFFAAWRPKHIDTAILKKMRWDLPSTNNMKQHEYMIKDSQTAKKLPPQNSRQRGAEKHVKNIHPYPIASFCLPMGYYVCLVFQNPHETRINQTYHDIYEYIY